MHWHLPSVTISLDLGVNIYLHPFFVYTRIEGCDESVQMCRPNWAFLLLITVISIKSHVLAHITEPTCFA